MAELLALEIEQGATYPLQFRWLDDLTGDLIDLTGYTASAQIRGSYDATTALISLTTDPGGGIEIVSSIVTMIIESDQTAALTVPAGAPYRRIGGRDFYEIGRWDFEFVVPSTLQVLRFLAGPVYLSPEVTR